MSHREMAIPRKSLRQLNVNQTPLRLSRAFRERLGVWVDANHFEVRVLSFDSDGERAGATADIENPRRSIQFSVFHQRFSRAIDSKQSRERVIERESPIPAGCGQISLITLPGHHCGDLSWRSESRHRFS